MPFYLHLQSQTAAQVLTMKPLDILTLILDGSFKDIGVAVGSLVIGLLQNSV